MNQEQQVLNKSRELFMRYGIRSVTMDDIAKELGMSKKTLYQYVDNKADLIEKIFRLKIEDEKMVMKKIREQSRDAIEEILKIGKYVTDELRQLSSTTVYDLQKYYRNTWKQMEALQKRHIYRIIRENIDWGMEQGLYRANMNPDIIAKLYVGKTSFITDDKIFPLRDYRIEELFRQHINYHIHGIASPEGLKLLEQHLAAEEEKIKLNE